jgi:hypothetical protein
MSKTKHPWALGIASILAATVALSPRWSDAQTEPANSKVIADIDLSKPFGGHAGWRLVATQAPDGPDPAFPDQTAPGIIRLCLNKAVASGCAVVLPPMPKRLTSPPDDLWGVARYLRIAEVVRPRGEARPPLVLLQTASAHGGDGGQVVFTQVYAYRTASNAFAQIYRFDTGTNNNEEVRFVSSGPLTGDVISAEPTGDAPFGYWITVNRLTPDYRYKQILRYRSATRYGDNNRLAVIDSEMPNIQQRLGLWRPGSALPLPEGKCPEPRLKHMELWCD